MQANVHENKAPINAEKLDEYGIDSNLRKSSKLSNNIQKLDFSISSEDNFRLLILDENKRLKEQISNQSKLHKETLDQTQALLDQSKLENARLMKEVESLLLKSSPSINLLSGSFLLDEAEAIRVQLQKEKQERDLQFEIFTSMIESLNDEKSRLLHINKKLEKEMYVIRNHYSNSYLQEINVNSIQYGESIIYSQLEELSDGLSADEKLFHSESSSSHAILNTIPPELTFIAEVNDNASNYSTKAKSNLISTKDDQYERNSSGSNFSKQCLYGIQSLQSDSIIPDEFRTKLIHEVDTLNENLEQQYLQFEDERRGLMKDLIDWKSQALDEATKWSKVVDAIETHNAKLVDDKGKLNEELSSVIEKLDLLTFEFNTLSKKLDEQVASEIQSKLELNKANEKCSILLQERDDLLMKMACSRTDDRRKHALKSIKPVSANNENQVPLAQSKRGRQTKPSDVKRRAKSCTPKLFDKVDLMQISIEPNLTSMNCCFSNLQRLEVPVHLEKSEMSIMELKNENLLLTNELSALMQQYKQCLNGMTYFDSKGETKNMNKDSSTLTKENGEPMEAQMHVLELKNSEGYSF